ncbi:uroporphyrin-III C-methyltransferase/precorrin-2 dehydrogenase/sirohydrochlorin ferrochelatase [Sinobacterium caligoides]|uniref:Siroheme synthase n=1 Tax=Sinobacterium caligoides TaxID=933926 RepID=A0A3N2DXM9_9GAMM|nr:siroheme synthase CysG [Sinobacterium caligoides]ROS04554.1 uroporphyrin-III C-methyltransferase/precorrin-2 dehydrogenase/sirohydrochlorin ferrochelatase [Sinobacterium caligoides]
MEFLPLFFDMKGKRCLIVGGGTIAYRKAHLIAKSGAVIDVVAPDICEDLSGIVKASKGQLLLKPYEHGLVDGYTLIIAATNCLVVNEQVSRDAQRGNIPVNVVDNPSLCSVILPAIIDRSPVVVAVSSGGKSPVLARQLRTKIESMIPSAYGRLGDLVGRFREAVKSRFQTIDQRRLFWEKTLDGPVAELVLAGKELEAQAALTDLLESEDEAVVGEVFLVGAGPGDPDLLTFKALRLMQKADVVLYDRLVSDEVVELCRKDAEYVYVGKARSEHSVPQLEINELLVKYAQEGRKVLRLKGGDPFIFGRGGEEIERLAELGIPFQVVPGITAAAGCASYSGIPLTHRDYSQSVSLVTGHLKNNTTDLNWEKLSFSDQTVVFYMGLTGLPVICQQLIAHGRAATTPIALIQQGTTRHHRVLTGTLETINAIVAAEKVRAPTLIIVGEVVNLHDKLNWFSPSV